MILTFSVNTKDTPDLGRAVVDAVTKVTRTTAEPFTDSVEWRNLVSQTRTFLEVGAELLTTAGSWAEWMVG